MIEPQTSLHELEMGRGPSRRWLVIAALLLVASLLIPLPSFGRVGWVVLDLLHVPAFVVLAMIVGTLMQWRMTSRPKLRMVLLWIGISLAGLVFEWLQGFSGRNPNWHDALANCAGAGAGLLVLEGIRMQQTSLRWFLYLAGIAVAIAGAYDSLGQLGDIVQQYQSVPQLASFETEAELKRWSAKRQTRALRSHKQATHGSFSLEVELSPGGYSGVDFRWPWSSWSEFEELVFDVRLDDGSSVALIVKIFDLEHTRRGYPHSDRFHKTATLSRGWQTVSIPLAQIREAPAGREMNLQEIAGVEFFVHGLESSRTLHLDNLRLR